MNNIKDERQKKLLLILPLLAIPFATLFFWSLGGGKTAHAQAATATLQGLNMKLPGAKLKNDSSQNKLSFYEQAEKDSLKFKQLRKDDPYYKADSAKDIIKKDSLKHYDTGIVPKSDNIIGRSFSTHSFSNSSASLAVNEQQINQKLAELNRQINQPPVPPKQQADNSGSSGNSRPDTQFSQLQAAMQKMNNANAPDPQMQQLSGMLDKIQEIQNPGLVREKLKAQSEKERGTVLPVSSSVNTGDATIMNGNGDGSNLFPFNNTMQQNGFYDLNQSNQEQDGNAIDAVVHETQTLTSGSTIKLRLLQDIFINGKLIPKETFVFGTCSVEGERLTVDIKTIRYHSSVFPVSMKVFDQDGLSGIYVPGAIARDAAKEGTDQAIQSYNPLSYDPSLGAQAATAGVTMAKGFFSKKVKLVKVTVKAGYAVLLLNGNQLNK